MKQSPLTPAQMLLAAGLALFGLSIPIQISMGVATYPSIPPGLFVSIGAALLILFGRWRWTTYLGFGLAIVLLIGTILSNWLPKLFDPSSTGYVGIVLQMIGLVIALIAGAIALFERRNSSSHKTKST